MVAFPLIFEIVFMVFVGSSALLQAAQGRVESSDKAVVSVFHQLIKSNRIVLSEQDYEAVSNFLALREELFLSQSRFNEKLRLVDKLTNDMAVLKEFLRVHKKTKMDFAGEIEGQQSIFKYDQIPHVLEDLKEKEAKYKDESKENNDFLKNLQRDYDEKSQMLILYNQQMLSIAAFLTSLDTI